MSKRPILVADDDPHILELLVYNLEQAGYDVVTARDGLEALDAVGQYNPSLVILDMLMPTVSGDAVCRALRNGHSTAALPIIILSALVDETDKLLAFECGADDYITKPFSVQELVLRVRAMLRWTSSDAPEMPDMATRGLMIDVGAREVTLDGAPVKLTRKEFELLRALVEADGRILTRDYLLDNVWGQDFFGETRTVDVHVRRLRQKLGRYADRVRTVRNLGYRYVIPKDLSD